jgi:hypothetical protein
MMVSHALSGRGAARAARLNANSFDGKATKTVMSLTIATLLIWQK